MLKELDGTDYSFLTTIVTLKNKCTWFTQLTNLISSKVLILVILSV